MNWVAYGAPAREGARIPPRRLAGVPSVQRLLFHWVVAQRIVPRRARSRQAARCRVVSRRAVRTHVVRRAAAYGLPVVLAGALITGCAGFDKAFGQREAIVKFQQGTPQAVRMSVRAACSHVPAAIPEPIPTDKKLSDYLNNVRYRIDKASDADLARLENCLNKFTSVRGVETPQDENS